MLFYIIENYAWAEIVQADMSQKCLRESLPEIKCHANVFTKELVKIFAFL